MKVYTTLSGTLFKTLSADFTHSGTQFFQLAESVIFKTDIPFVYDTLAINLKHGNTDAAGFIEDEYEMVVNIGVEGWEEF